jgi:hypothetical protein
VSRRARGHNAEQASGRTRRRSARGLAARRTRNASRLRRRLRAASEPSGSGCAVSRASGCAAGTSASPPLRPKKLPSDSGGGAAAGRGLLRDGERRLPSTARGTAARVARRPRRAGASAPAAPACASMARQGTAPS